MRWLVHKPIGMEAEQPVAAAIAPAADPPAAAATAAPQPLHVDGAVLSGLQLAYADGKGHHIVSTRCVHAGATLLTESPVAASTAAVSALPSYCQRCLTALAGVSSSKRAICER